MVIVIASFYHCSRDQVSQELPQYTRFRIRIRVHVLVHWQASRLVQVEAVTEQTRRDLRAEAPHLVLRRRRAARSRGPETCSFSTCTRARSARAGRARLDASFREGP